MTKLLTTKFKTHLASQLLESVNEPANTAYYVYAGVHDDVIGDIPVPADDNRQVVIDAYRNMIFGKRVENDDVSLVVRYIPWVSGKVFAMYDDSDRDLLEKDFFCQVDEGSLIHTYKCLNNHFNSPSTVEPIYTYVEAVSDYMFNTSDNYVWKYMYSVPSGVKRKFTTQNYFPVTTNPDVQSNTRKGTVDVIRIEQNDLEIQGGGKRYDNYLTGTWSTTDLRVNGNNYLYKISNDNISYTAGFYTGCVIYLTEGTGSGQYQTIADYYHNANGNFVGLLFPFDIEPLNGTTYEIYPEVKIYGSGTQSVDARARALVNPEGSNSVYKVEIFERGLGYNYLAAQVIANTAVTDDVNFVAAELWPIYGPDWGHGSDCPEELGARHIEFAVKFANSESNTLLTDNRYQQVGLLKDPAFANVYVEIGNTSGIFQTGEQVFKVSPMRINSNVHVSNSSAEITGQMSVLSNVSIVTAGTLGNYIPDDILDIEGGTALEVAQVKVLQTKVRSATINAAGTGYTPGIFTANLSLGTAVTNATFSVTANATGNCASIIITNPGKFADNPPFLPNSAPVGGSGSGLTLNITMGLEAVEIFNSGAYAVIPTDLATNNPISNIGTGANAELLITFTATLSSDFLKQLTVGGYVMLSNPANTLHQIATVQSITNNTLMAITVNGYFSCAAAHMYLPNISSSAELVESANSTILVISDVNQELSTSDIIIGRDSGAKAQVNTIFRNGTNKNFDTFIQLYKYDVAVLSNTFIENETVFQGDSMAFATAWGTLHSVVTVAGDTILYTSNQVGQFNDSVLIKGADSLAVASINEMYSPELEFGVGDVLYIENIEPVERAPDQNETFQIIIGF